MTQAHLIFLIFISLSLFRCGDQTDGGSSSKVNIVFENQSQFEVKKLFVHREPLGYLGESSLIGAPLASGGSYTGDLPPTEWYVTVFRELNKDGDLFAFTTSKAWNPVHYPKIIYYDEQFRVSK